MTTRVSDDDSNKTKQKKQRVLMMIDNDTKVGWGYYDENESMFW